MKLTLLALLSGVSTLLAHEVWIEDTPEGRLVLRFAEYGEPYEKSPGALDSLTHPFAWLPGAAPETAPPVESAKAPTGEARRIQAGKVNTVEVRKQADGYELQGAQPAQAVQAETGFTVMGTAGNPGKPASKPYFYARWQPPGSGPATPALNLDIVPTEKAGEARVYLRGQPAPGLKVNFHPPVGIEQELTTDAEGKITFTAQAPGLYLLTVARQREKIAGFFGGKPFDVTSHNCSLAWRQK